MIFSFSEIIRSVAADLVEQVVKVYCEYSRRLRELNAVQVDEFKNKEGRLSQCYRITYRSNERSVLPCNAITS